MTKASLSDRITEGVTRQRLKMEARRAARPLLTVLLGAAMTAAILLFLVSQISGTIGQPTRTVRIKATTAFGVFPGVDEVRYRGVPAGTIAEIERRGSQIVLVAKVRKSFGPIYQDARMELRPITPLNDEYLDIVDQGHERAGEADPDVPLPASQLKVSVTVPDVLDTLEADERVALNRLLDNLGNGTADRGLALRAAFAQVTPFLHAAGQLTQQLAVRRKATKRLIHNASVLTDELGRRQGQLRTLVQDGALTLEALHQGSGDLDRTLQELAPTATELRAGMAAVRRVVGDVDAGLSSLGPVADRLPAALTALRKLNTDLTPTLRVLRDDFPPLTRVIAPLPAILDDVRGATAALRPQLPVVSKVTRDLVACERGVIGFFHWNTSLTKFGDLMGPVPRGNLAFGVPAVSSSQPLRPMHKGCTPGTPERGVITEAGKR